MIPQAAVVISEKGFTPYGGASSFFYSKAPEIIISGPYDTGKTITALQKLNLLMCLFDNAQALMVRKTYTSLVHSAVVTFEKKIHNGQIGHPNYPITKYGKERPQHYDYPNSSRIVLGGLDNPEKTLSAEYDFIYVNQAEELTEDEWQALTRACTGRAGNAPYTQIFADCNPDVPDHWIQTRQRLLLVESRHEDNPEIFDQENGKLIAPERMEALDAMTGVRKKRGRYGLWVGREGQVYDFDPAIHLIDRFDIPADWRRLRAIDFGFTNPFVCQFWAMDNDGRLYLYHEIYMSQRTVKEHSKRIKAISGNQRFEATIADHDAEDRATLQENGITTIAADKRVSIGIEKVQERLKIAGDGKPRLFILRDSVDEVDPVLSAPTKKRPISTEKEFPGYVYPETKAKRAADEHPVKSDDHGMDTLRYLVMHFDAPDPTPSWSSIQGLGKIEDFESRWQ